MQKRKMVLLDGGMGQELVHRSEAPPGPMWGAKVLMEEPHLVSALHAEYIEAGARVITLNAYSLTPERLARVNAEDQFPVLQKRAIELARQGRDMADRGDVLIAGTLPPLYGSYDPSTYPGEQEALDVYRKIVEIQAPHVDVFICETMSSVKESIATVTAAGETNLPVWLGLTVNDDSDGMLRSGETITSAFDAVQDLNPQAVLINCSIPEAVTAAWQETETLPCAIGAYANGFTSIVDLKIGGTVDMLRARTDLGPAEYALHAMKWVDRGAGIVGGCCEITPAHIRHLAMVLTDDGYEITSRLQAGEAG